MLTTPPPRPTAPPGLHLRRSETILTDHGRELVLPTGYTAAANQLLDNSPQGQEHCLVVVGPDESPALREVAIGTLAENFLEKDGVSPQSFRAHLETDEPPYLDLLLQRSRRGPIPLGALQISVNEEQPPASIRDIEAVFGINIAELCARTTMPNGRPLPDLSQRQHFREVASNEAVALWPEYRKRRYSGLLYAQMVQFVIAHPHLDKLTAILDQRPGEAFDQIQDGFERPFIYYAHDPHSVPLKVYWVEGKWAYLRNKIIEIGADGWPTEPVPNFSGPVICFLRDWLSTISQATYDILMGDTLTPIAAFDPRYRPGQTRLRVA
jgi:hypothetical protein